MTNATNNEVVKVEAEIDVTALRDIIGEATTLNDNDEVFAKLSQITKAKNEIKDLLDQVESVEAEAKSLINSRAKTLYTNDWSVISGTGYKITRSSSGAIYQLNPDIPAQKKYLKVTTTVNADAVKKAIEESGKLPKGIELNPHRGEVIKVSIK